MSEKDKKLKLLLKDSEYKGTSDYKEIHKTLKAIANDDFREEFVYLVSKLKNK